MKKPVWGWLKEFADVPLSRADLTRRVLLQTGWWREGNSQIPPPVSRLQQGEEGIRAGHYSLPANIYPQFTSVMFMVSKTKSDSALAWRLELAPGAPCRGLLPSWQQAGELSSITVHFSGWSTFQLDPVPSLCQARHVLQSPACLLHKAPISRGDRTRLQEF